VDINLPNIATFVVAVAALVTALYKKREAKISSKARIAEVATGMLEPMRNRILDLEEDVKRERVARRRLEGHVETLVAGIKTLTGQLVENNIVPCFTLEDFDDDYKG